MRPAQPESKVPDPNVRRLKAQELIGISTPTFYRLVAQGKLNAFKIGRSTRVKTSEIERFLASCPRLTSRTGLKTDH